MLRSAILVLSGHAATSLLLLARNLIVARMIPVADYGVAATFAIAMAVVEMATSLGLQKQIVQAADGDDPRFQAGLQGFQVLRGALAALVLFALAGVLAGFLGIPEAAWAYQVLALVPLLNALQHFDIHRLNRKMRFLPLVLSGSIPALLSLLLVWPLVSWFGDWQVMLWAIMAQSAITALVSHVLAERPYRLALDKAIMMRSLSFGWPLLLNALLLFLVFQGDKVIVGHVLGMEDLAIFAMGVTLTLTPTLVLAKSAQNLFLPKLSALHADAQSHSGAFNSMAHATLQAAIFNAAIVILLVALFGDILISVLLGARYMALVPLLQSFALLHGIRVLKAGTAVIAMSCRHTANAMIGNLPRVAALPLAWLLLTNGGTLQQLLWLGISAELLGYIVSLFLIHHRPGVALRPMWPVALTGLLFLFASNARLLLATNIPDLFHGIATIAGFLALLLTMKELRRHVLARVSVS